MKKYLFLLLCYSVIGSNLLAQKHDNIWLMGRSGGSVSPTNDSIGITVFDFSTGELVISNNQIIEMNMADANVAFSNADGELQYYSNGIYIEDYSFQTMVNGEAINAWQDIGFNLPQGILGLPYPDNENLSILFNVQKGYVNIPGWTLEAIGLYYSVIDMSLNNGLGEVTVKREPLIIDTLGYGKLTATKHANGRDWWMVINESHTNRFYKILIDNTGIQILGNQTVGTPSMQEGLGQAVFSPDGNNYVIFNSIDEQIGQFIEIYDFDRCTGELSNQSRIHFDQNVSGGVAISPSSQYLYVSSYEQIYQFDLWSNDIESTKIKVAEFDGYQFLGVIPTKFYLAQLAPDGKIYINTTNNVDVLHVIHNPDEQGLACNLEQHGIHLPTYNLSLPGYPNYRLGSLDGSLCDTIVTDVELVQNSSINIYPNPTTDYVNVLFGNHVEKDLNFLLSNSLGQIVLMQKLSKQNEQRIDLDRFIEGVYFYSVNSSDGIITSGKLVILDNF